MEDQKFVSPGITAWQRDVCGHISPETYFNFKNQLVQLVIDNPNDFQLGIAFRKFMINRLGEEAFQIQNEQE